MIGAAASVWHCGCGVLAVHVMVCQWLTNHTAVLRNKSLYMFLSKQRKRIYTFDLPTGTRHSSTLKAALEQLPPMQPPGRAFFLRRLKAKIDQEERRAKEEAARRAQVF